jgi:membrane-associated phospholipid phosphatase
MKVNNSIYFFLIPYLFILSIACYGLLEFHKGTFELYINSNHNIFLDWFFYLITELGNGWFFFIVAVFLFMMKERAISILLLIQLIIKAVLIYILKFQLFNDEPRPPLYFEGKLSLHFVEGSKIFYQNSFPSGHAMSAFVLFFTLALFMNKNYLSFVFFILALLVAISRMYLLKHFLLDVSVGSILGILIAWSSYYYIYLKYLNPKLNVKR